MLGAAGEVPPALDAMEGTGAGGAQACLGASAVGRGDTARGPRGQELCPAYVCLGPSTDVLTWQKTSLTSVTCV